MALSLALSVFDGTRMYITILQYDASLPPLPGGQTPSGTKDKCAYRFRGAIFAHRVFTQFRASLFLYSAGLPQSR